MVVVTTCACTIVVCGLMLCEVGVETTAGFDMAIGSTGGGVSERTVTDCVCVTSVWGEDGVVTDALSGFETG